MKKLVAGGVATLSIVTGSLGLAALNPFGVASAQTTGSSATTATAPADAPQKGQGLSTVLTALVADGTITQAQSDAITAKLDAWRAANPAPERGGRGGGMAGAAPEAIASALGITAEDLQTKLAGGATLRSIAGDKLDALTALLTTQANERIDQGVTDGRITAETAATMKAEVPAKVQELLDRTGGAGKGGPGGMGMGKGKGGERGPRGGAPATSGSAPAASGSTTTN